MPEKTSWRVQHQPADAPLPASWDTLNRAACRDHPLLASPLLEAALRHFGRKTVHLATLENDRGGCRGHALVTPLSRLRWGLFHPSQLPLGPILLDPGLESPAGALNSLLRSLPGAGAQLDLTQLDPWYFPLGMDSPQAELVPYVNTVGITVRGRRYEDYLEQRPRKLRSNLRRYQRRVAEAGLVLHLRRDDTPAAVADAVNIHGLLESAGWKGRQGTALHPDNEQGRFYRDYLCAEAARGRACAYRLQTRGQTVATWLVAFRGHQAMLLKTAYDESLARLAIGRLMLAETLEDLFRQDGLQRIEFYTNANADQMEWGTDSRAIQHLNFYRHAALRHAWQLGRRLRHGLRARRTDQAAA
ncbi:GNAT family N-acetyltransferase [Halorhodospira sp. M39old]|uniref:GNAT family N-acetyltransferase n=1 Tax=Halorhodospira sp. M39old TaxID=2899131 RepID=UPI001EE868A4|nr:GNAT family N-acetyltransferase [Halorhodospira sp. M39old]MCG5540150.1 GNAT family N-acetyltransferase [Halorhodospira sp. M39old]